MDQIKTQIMHIYFGAKRKIKSAMIKSPGPAPKAQVLTCKIN